MAALRWTGRWPNKIANYANFWSSVPLLYWWSMMTADCFFTTPDYVKSWATPETSSTCSTLG